MRRGAALPRRGGGQPALEPGGCQVPTAGGRAKRARAGSVQRGLALPAVTTADGRLIGGREESAARDFADRTAEILNWSPASSLRYNDRMLGLTQVATLSDCRA